MTGQIQKQKIGIGHRVGHLTVESATEERKGGYTVWNCQCDCGGSIKLDTRCLQRQTVQDCGCITPTTPGQKDLRDRRFGRLTPLYPTEKRIRGNTVWVCQCECGNLCEAVSTQLTSGYKKSCGCLGHPPLKEMVGKRFGKLVVTGYGGKRAGMHRWVCRCDCGRETIVGQTLLQSGKTQSCGCRRKEQLQDNLKIVNGTSVVVLESKKKPSRANTSGYTGVYQEGETKHWRAQIRFKGKTYSLGRYTKIEDAIAARQEGEKMHDDFIRWYYEEYCANESLKEPGLSDSSQKMEQSAINPKQ